VRLVPAVIALVGALVFAAPLSADTNAARAKLAYRSMEQTFHDTKAGLYRETTQDGTPATAWPYSQAVAATIALSYLPQVGKRYKHVAAQRIADLNRYARDDGAYAAVAGDNDVYFDDNEWIALDLLDWHERTGNAPSLKQAQRLFSLVTNAWDGDESHPCPGGVFWTTSAGNHDRNTVTTATGALLAMRLFEATGDSLYLQWARQMIAWVEKCMAAPNGLLWDHIDLNGNINQHQWSYNQGTAIGTYVLLYRLTGDRNALLRAQELAWKSLDQLDHYPNGAEPPYFLAIFFRNLLTLEQVDHNPAYRTAMQTYADAVWSVRDARTGLFNFPSPQPATLLEHAGVVQLYALLAAKH